MMVDWKRFDKEYEFMRNELSRQGIQGPDEWLLKIMAFITGGQSCPDSIARQAVVTPSEESFLDHECGLPSYEPQMGTVTAVTLQDWAEQFRNKEFLLGEIYERTAMGRRAQGRYYTPAKIIDFIMSWTVEECAVTLNPYVRVLDPACGCGNFLVKAYDVLRQKFWDARPILQTRYPEIDWSDDGIHRHIIRYNLWGADIDGTAAKIAALSLLLKRPEASRDLIPNIRQCDSLRRPDENSGSSDKTFWAAAYDYVVGNPPYLSFGLRGGQALDPGYGKYLRQAFVACAEYKISYYALFMQRGIELLKPGGRLGFIVPDSFLLGRYFSKLRRYLLDYTAVKAIVHIAAPVFRQAALGFSVIGIFEKELDGRKRIRNAVKVYSVKDYADLPLAKSCCQYEQDYFNRQVHCRFRLFFDLTAKRLVDKLDSGVYLGKFAVGHTGIRARTRQKDIVAQTRLGETWQPGLISGSQVNRYCLKYQGHWLNIDPRLLYKGGWQAEVVRQRKILVRQTGYNIIACIDEQGYYHLNNIHSFVLKNNEVSLEYLLLLLNSRLMSFYYHATTLEFGRPMAQTDIETLERLPVRFTPEAVREANGLVKKMTDCLQRIEQGDRMASREQERLAARMDELVYQIYGLTTEEIKYVEDYERALFLSRRKRRDRNSSPNSTM
ncbi:N-6 DNA methylase [Thermosinus carboxydivorans Nor1]|uniref:site-specific DNA-methyltransferase (adenine-specific) n=1 Tax=Thermosinus carboxydivorans Nor1 TaxID=401526 RepID=A1HPY6_9FIRM|nr:N-6 DNA methylase [Thermosinus carboxydivorans]EAX47838.1 N-6 DNA methylase [Thermosinus carboxydivorans Nor1]